MGGLAEFRAQFPQYDDMPDAVLADRLYERHYSDLPRDQFDAKLGIAAPTPAPVPAPAADFDTSEFASVETSLAPDPDGRGGEFGRAIATGLGNVGPAFRQQGAGLRQMGAETTLGKLDEHIATLGTGDFYRGPMAPMMQNELAAFAMERGALPKGKVTPQQVRSALDAFAGGMTPADRAAFAERVRGKVQGRADAAGADFRAATADMQPIDAPDGSAAYYAGNIATSVATNMPGLLASIVLRNPAPAMIGIGAQSGGAAYGEGRDRGLEPKTAREYAGLTALAEGIPEALPVSRLLATGAKGFFKDALEVSAAEALSESLTAALQAAIDKGYIEPDMTWGEARGRIIDSAIMGAGSGPVMTAIARGAQETGRIAGDAAGAAGSAVGSAVGRVAGALTPQRPPAEAAGRALGAELASPATADRVNQILAERGLPPVPQIIQPSQLRPDQGSIFVGRDGAPANVDGVNGEVLRRLAITQDRFGKQIPIISGHRTPTENANAKGARRSQHMEGNALDLDVRGLSKAERLKLIETASMAGFTGIGVYDNTIHLDMGARRSWGPSYKRASVPGWAEDTVQRHLNGELRDVSDMAPADQRVQPDMLGGEDMTDTQIAARDRVDQVTAEIDPDADPVEAFKATVAAAEGEPAEFADAVIEEAAMRGMLGQEFTDTPDFESTFPIPRTAEARAITGFNDAERQVDARMAAKVFFREAKTAVVDDAAEAKQFIEGGQIDRAEQAIARIEQDVATIRDAFGDEIATKFEAWAGKSLAEMQAELRFARAKAQQAGPASQAPQEPAPAPQPQTPAAPQGAAQAPAQGRDEAAETPRARAARIRDLDGLWANMDMAERKAVLLRAGFAAKAGKNKGDLTTAGRRIAMRDWANVVRGEGALAISREMRTAADQVVAEGRQEPAAVAPRPAPPPVQEAAPEPRPAPQGNVETPKPAAPPKAEAKAPQPPAPEPAAESPPAPPRNAAQDAPPITGADIGREIRDAVLRISPDPRDAAEAARHAEASAAVWTAWFETMAERTGRPIGELWAAMKPQIVAAEAGLDAQGRRLDQPAWHGSPHIFDRFSTAYLGTGEGAQAFGWGMYFAQKRGIAKFYRDKEVSKRRGKKSATFKFDGLTYDPSGASLLSVRDLQVKLRSVIAEAWASEMNAPKPSLISKVEKFFGVGQVYYSSDFQLTERWKLYVAHSYDAFSIMERTGRTILTLDEVGAELLALLRARRPSSVHRPSSKEVQAVWDIISAFNRHGGTVFIAGGDPNATGRLYQVDLPEDDVLLDWTVRVESQPTAVKRALRKIAAKAKIRIPDMASGEVAYADLSRALGGDKAASQALAEAGVMGHKFADATSRSANERRTFNFVIYRDEAVRITSYEQRRSGDKEPRGSIFIPTGGVMDGGTIIALGRAADRSTFLHETGHFFLEGFTALASAEGVAPQMRDDLATLHDWLGAKPGEAYTVAQHEKFAASFEQYLMEGQAPSKGLARVFKLFKNWLTAIYQTIVNTGGKLSPQVRAVFDRMLATDAQIAEMAAPAEAPSPYPAGTGTPDMAEGTPASVFGPGTGSQGISADGFIGHGGSIFREGALPKAYETAARKAGDDKRKISADAMSRIIPKDPQVTIAWRVYDDGGQGVSSAAGPGQFVSGISEGGNVVSVPAPLYDLVVHRMGAEFRLESDKPNAIVGIVLNGEVIGAASQHKRGSEAYTADFLRSLPAFEDGPREPGRSISPKAPPEPKAKRNLKDVPKAAIEEARRVTLARFDRAAEELGKQIRAKGTEGVTVEAKRPTGTTTLTFPPTEEGLERLLETRAKWAKMPAQTLAMPAATAAQTTAPPQPGTATPGPASNPPPLLGSIVLPPAAGARMDLGNGRSVEMPGADNPQRKKPIERAVIRLIGPRIYKGKVNGKAVAGFYRPKQGELRLANEQDVEVLAHEMAHWMDHTSSLRGLWSQFARGETATGAALQAQIAAEIESLSYTDAEGKLQIEGFAEFMRAWLTFRPGLAQSAPAALAEFERILSVLDKGPRRDQRAASGLRSIQEQMHRWYFQGDLARLRAKEGDGDTYRDRLGDWMANRPADLLRQRLVDHIHAAKVVERTVTGTINDATRSAYKQFQMVNGAESMHEAVLRYGTPRLGPAGDIVFDGKGLIEVLGPAMTATKFPLLMDYFKARRGAELMQQGRENLFTQGEIDAGLALAATHPEFPAIFTEWQAFNARMLEFYVQMGLITPDQRAAFQQANADYVPFHRIIESIEDGEGTGGGKIGPRLTGGAQNVRDIAENIVQGLFHNIRGALQARAKATLYKQILAHEDGALFAARIGPDSKKVRAHVEEMAKRVAQIMAAEGLTISNNGMIVAGDPDAVQVTDIKDIEARLIADPSLLEFWIHGQRPNTTGTIVDSAIIDGERVWFEVSDELLADMLMAQKGLRAAGIPLKIGQFVRRFISRAVTNALQFLPSNLARDTVSASIMSQHGFVPLYDSIAGMYHTVARTPLYREFMLNGGGYGTLPQTLTGDDSTTRARRQLLLPGRPLLRSPVGATVDAFDKLLMAWDSAAALFEYGSRVGEFRRARQAGKNAMEAAWHAREISTDFARRPADEGWAKLMSTVPFMNAGLQGIDRDLRALVQPSREGFDSATVEMERGPDGQWRAKDTSRRLAFKKVMARGAMVAGWTALLWFLNQDEERYQGLTDDERNRFWWLFPPWMEQPVKIPKPYGLGFLFGTAPEAALQAAKDRDGKEAAKTLAWGMAHNYLFWDYPGLLQPFIEDMANKKWNGSPIVPEYLRDAPADIQFNDRTPLLYRALGESLGVSPLRAQHYTRSFLGYYEQMMADGTEAMLWRGDEWGERPFARGPASWATHAFQGGRVAYRTKWTEGYFDLRRRAQGAQIRLRVLQRDAPQNMQRAVGAMTDPVQQTLAGLSSAFAQIDRGMADMPDAVKAIKYDPALTADQKERRIEALYASKNRSLAKFYDAAQTALDRAEKRMEALK